MSKTGFSYRSLDFVMKIKYSGYIRGNMQKKEE